jgi:hypothetical protein
MDINVVRKQIKAKVALKFGGDDKRTMHDLAVDLINASGLDWKEVANGCYLCKSTVKNLATQKTRFPRADTLERVFKYFEYGGTLQAAKVSAKNANKKKGK